MIASAHSIKQNKFFEALLIGLTTFCIYTCMYAIRKPFTALIFDEKLFGYGIKSWMVISQLLGYTCSKFFGISFFGNLKRKNRSSTISILLFVSVIPLLLMPLTPLKLWPLWFFLNGFPLGLIWGLVFSFVEGRRLTEFIGAILACTFIFSSGMVKSLAIYLQEIHFMTKWIPFFIAVAFYIPSIVFSFLLEKLPEPSIEEKLENAPRLPLNQLERKTFIKKYKIFIISTILTYCILTLIRDSRDNFSAELMKALNIYHSSSLSQLETALTVFMLLCIPFISRIRNHKRAILITLFTTIIGGFICAITPYLFKHQYIDGYMLLLLSGTGVYLGYILINISIMDRLVALNGSACNSGFLVYMADSFGYLMTLTISGTALFTQKGDVPWLYLFEQLLKFGGIIIIIGAIISIVQIKKYKQEPNI